MTEHHLPLGFSYGGIHCGIKENGSRDLALVLSERPCHTASVFTKNLFASAHILYDRQLLDLNPDGVQAVLVNSGNANAVTGTEGLANARRSAEAVESVLGLSPWSTFVMSTGVIGVPLAVDRIEAALPGLFQSLRADSSGFEAASRAIMTTDTRPKLATLQGLYEGQAFNIAGLAKGSGMIHPNMATMLALITTDVSISTTALDLALKMAVERTFNRISVDGDTSTNDTVVVLANGATGHPMINDSRSPAFDSFVHALTEVSEQLARDIVRDGEGATKLVTIKVSGLENDVMAHKVANTIAISPLVKTAIYGGDANWGRIIMAAGNAGVAFDTKAVELWFEGSTLEAGFSNGLHVLSAGTPLDYDETLATDHFKQPELLIDLRLGDGTGQAIVWTCDLSHEYVTINGEYRT